MVMHLIYKAHGLMERLKKMQKHFLQHYLILIELPSMLTTQDKKEIYLDDMILDSDVYTVTDGKIKTSLHVMTGQSVYSSRSNITSLN